MHRNVCTSIHMQNDKIGLVYTKGFSVGGLLFGVVTKECKGRTARTEFWNGLSYNKPSKLVHYA